MTTPAAATVSSSTLNDNVEEDVETQKQQPSMAKVPHWRLVASQSLITTQVLNHQYRGSGTTQDPYVVEFVAHDPRNPMEWSLCKKWFVTMVVAISTLAVSFVASAFSGGIKQVIEVFGCSQEVATLGLSLYVLGFALGPLVWAPFSELYGRQILFFVTFGMLTLFNATAAASNSITTLLVLRFLAGTFGSSPLTNAGGVIADMFPANQRGLATGIFSACPFLGPAIGPIVGGFAGQSLGFRWIEGIMACFTGFLWILGSLTIPETYAPVLLKRRAEALSTRTEKTYISIIEHRQGKPSPAAAFKTAIVRPWALLFLEPIVLLISIYMAIIYGTLFLLFGAFPIVFQEGRGWSQGVGGLAFLGVAVGMIAGTAYAIFDNGRYRRVEEAHGGRAPPEEGRLPPAMLGAVAIPIGMFWFAWTNGPSIHWIVCVIACVPFGAGMVLVFLPCVNYLIDGYTIYAASVLAANSVLRSLFGAAFPLFTDQMYKKLGIHWASSLPAFLALACTPMPFVFYKYGESIRMKCKYAARAHETMEQLRLSRQRTNDQAQGGIHEGGEEK